VVSIVLAILTIPTVVGVFVGMVGIPVGALVGFVAAPRLVAAERPGPLVALSSLVATVLGTGGYAVVWAISEGRGASLADLMTFAAVNMGIAGAIGLAFGGPMSLVAAFVATSLLRRWREWAERLSILSGLLVAAVVVATGSVLVAAFLAPGDQAAQYGDRVPFTYSVQNRGGQELYLEIRSYWKGEVAGGSSSDLVGDCTAGTDSLQGSDWAIWLGPDSEWRDRPAGDPLISSHQYPDHIPVRLHIVIAADRAISIEPGAFEESTCG
jgi:hypothetical protein